MAPILFSHFLLIFAASPPPAHDEACGWLENRLPSVEITDRDWRAFRRVARHRRQAKLEIVPGIPLCEPLNGSEADLRRDRESVALLRRLGLSEERYVLTGWALVVARHSDDFPRMSGTVTARNRAFVALHRAEVDALLGGN